MITQKPQAATLGQIAMHKWRWGKIARKKVKNEEIWDVGPRM